MNYQYDTSGNCIKETNEYNGTKETTSYTYDRFHQLTEVANPLSLYQDIISILDLSSNQTSAIVYGVGVIGEITAGNNRYYQIDNRNNIIGVYGEDGIQTKRIEYDELGIPNPIDLTENTPFSPVFTGYLYEEDTGLYYAKARYYQQKTGRFLNQDRYEKTPLNPVSKNRYKVIPKNIKD